VTGELVRGDVVTYTPRARKGHQQAGPTLAVVLQRDAITLSTVIVAPTSRSAQEASFRPIIDVDGESTKVLVEQVVAANRDQLGNQVGRVSMQEQSDIDQALLTVLSLD
jgi:mRNA interferase MazF